MASSNFPGSHKRTRKPATTRDSVANKQHDVELEQRCRYHIMTLRLSAEEEVLDVESFNGVDWLKEEAPWPPDVQRRVHRYMHEKNLYRVSNPDDPAFVDLVDLVKSQAGVPNTRNWEQKVSDKCRGLINTSTRTWIRDGLLVARNNLIIKAEDFQYLWDCAIQATQESYLLAQSINRTFPRIELGNVASLVEFDSTAGAGWSPEDSRAEKRSAESMQQSRSSSSAKRLRVEQSNLRSDVEGDSIDVDCDVFFVTSPERDLADENASNMTTVSAAAPSGDRHHTDGNIPAILWNGSESTVMKAREALSALSPAEEGRGFLQEGMQLSQKKMSPEFVTEPTEDIEPAESCSIHENHRTNATSSSSSHSNTISSVQLTTPVDGLSQAASVQPMAGPNTNQSDSSSKVYLPSVRQTTDWDVMNTSVNRVGNNGHVTSSSKLHEAESNLHNSKLISRIMNPSLANAAETSQAETRYYSLTAQISAQVPQTLNPPNHQPPLADKVQSSPSNEAGNGINSPRDSDVISENWYSPSPSEETESSNCPERVVNAPHVAANPQNSSQNNGESQLPSERQLSQSINITKTTAQQPPPPKTTDQDRNTQSTRLGPPGPPPPPGLPPISTQRSSIPPPPPPVSRQNTWPNGPPLPPPQDTPNQSRPPAPPPPGPPPPPVSRQNTWLNGPPPPPQRAPNPNQSPPPAPPPPGPPPPSISHQNTWLNGPPPFPPPRISGQNQGPPGPPPISPQNQRPPGPPPPPPSHTSDRNQGPPGPPPISHQSQRPPGPPPPPLPRTSGQNQGPPGPPPISLRDQRLSAPPPPPPPISQNPWPNGPPPSPPRAFYQNQRPPPSSIIPQYHRPPGAPPPVQCQNPPTFPAQYSPSSSAASPQHQSPYPTDTSNSVAGPPPPQFQSLGQQQPSSAPWDSAQYISQPSPTPTESQPVGPPFAELGSASGITFPNSTSPTAGPTREMVWKKYNEMVIIHVPIAVKTNANLTRSRSVTTYTFPAGDMLKQTVTELFQWISDLFNTTLPLELVFEFISLQSGVKGRLILSQGDSKLLETVKTTAWELFREIEMLDPAVANIKILIMPIFPAASGSCREIIQQQSQQLHSAGTASTIPFHQPSYLSSPSQSASSIASDSACRPSTTKSGSPPPCGPPPQSQNNFFGSPATDTINSHGGHPKSAPYSMPTPHKKTTSERNVTTSNNNIVEAHTLSNPDLQRQSPQQPAQVPALNSTKTDNSPSTAKIVIRIQIDGHGRLSCSYDKSTLNTRTTSARFFAWFSQETGHTCSGKLRFDFKDALPAKSSVIEAGNDDHFDLMVCDIKRKFERAKNFAPDLNEFCIVVTDPLWDSGDEDDDE